MNTYPFKDRLDAGRQLAVALTNLTPEKPLVLGLPRGGVPVAYQVAKALAAPLDILLVRKIGAPGAPELGLGAVVDGQHPQCILNEELVKRLKPDAAYIEAEEQRQLEEIERRRRLYCKDRLPLDVRGRTVIVVDDGVATGATMTAAFKALIRDGVAKLLFAVPVASNSALACLRSAADDGICLLSPSGFRAVSMYYENFEQTTDEEVIALLNAALRETGASKQGQMMSGAEDAIGVEEESGAVPPDATTGEIPPDGNLLVEKKPEKPAPMR